MSDINDQGPPSRKIRAAVWMSLAVILHTWLVSVAQVPDSIAINSLWALSIGWFLVLGGQSVIDSIEKWKPTYSTKQETASTVTVKKEQ